MHKRHAKGKEKARKRFEHDHIYGFGTIEDMTSAVGVQAEPIGAWVAGGHQPGMRVIHAFVDQKRLSRRRRKLFMWLGDCVDFNAPPIRAVMHCDMVDDPAGLVEFLDKSVHGGIEIVAEVEAYRDADPEKEGDPREPMLVVRKLVVTSKTVKRRSPADTPPLPDVPDGSTTPFVDIADVHCELGGPLPPSRTWDVRHVIPIPADAVHPIGRCGDVFKRWLAPLLNGGGGVLWLGVRTDMVCEGVFLDVGDMECLQNKLKEAHNTLCPPFTRKFQPGGSRPDSRVWFLKGRFSPRVGPRGGGDADLHLVRIEVPACIFAETPVYISPPPTLYIRDGPNTVPIKDPGDYTERLPWMLEAVSAAAVHANPAAADAVVASMLPLRRQREADVPPRLELFQNVETAEYVSYGESQKADFKHANDGSDIASYLKRSRKHTVGFLNAGSGGRLLFGVEDDASVHGVFLRNEESVTQPLEALFAMLVPPVPRSCWSIHFIPVALGPGTEFVGVSPPQHAGHAHIIAFDEAPKLETMGLSAVVRIDVAGHECFAVALSEKLRGDARQRVITAAQSMLDHAVVACIHGDAPQLKDTVVVELRWRATRDRNHMFLLNQPVIQLATAMPGRRTAIVPMSPAMLRERCVLSRRHAFDMPAHYVPLPEREPAAEALSWLALYGPPGTGKSTMAAAVANRVAQAWIDEGTFDRAHVVLVWVSLYGGGVDGRSDVDADDDDPPASAGFTLRVEIALRAATDKLKGSTSRQTKAHEHEYVPSHADEEQALNEFSDQMMRRGRGIVVVWDDVSALSRAELALLMSQVPEPSNDRRCLVITTGWDVPACPGHQQWEVRPVGDADTMSIVRAVLRPAAAAALDPHIPTITCGCRQVRHHDGALPRVAVLVASVLRRLVEQGRMDDAVSFAEQLGRHEGRGELLEEGGGVLVLSVKLALGTTSDPVASETVMLALCMWPRTVHLSDLTSMLALIGVDSPIPIVDELLALSLCVETDGVLAIDDCVREFGLAVLRADVRRAFAQCMLGKMEGWRSAVGLRHERRAPDREDVLSIQRGLLDVAYGVRAAADCGLELRDTMERFLNLCEIVRGGACGGGYKVEEIHSIVARLTECDGARPLACEAQLGTLISTRAVTGEHVQMLVDTVGELDGNSLAFAQRTISAGYQCLGDVDAARRWLKRAVLVTANVPVMHSLMCKELGLLEQRHGDEGRAREHLDNALSEQDGLGYATIDLPVIHYRLSKFKGASQDAFRAAQLCSEIHGSTSDLARKYIYQAARAAVSANSSAVTPLVHEMLDGLQGERSARVARVMHVLGILHRNARELDVSEELLRGAVEIQESISHGGRNVAYYLHSLGQSLLMMAPGRLDDAVDTLRRAVAVRDVEDVEKSRTMHTLGRALLRMRGGEAEAERVLSRAVAVAKDAGAQPRHVARCLCDHGHALSLIGDFEQAERVLMDAAAEQRMVSGDNERYIQATDRMVASVRARLPARASPTRLIGRIVKVAQGGEIAFVTHPDYPGNVFLHRGQVVGGGALRVGGQVEFGVRWKEEGKPQCAEARLL